MEWSKLIGRSLGADGEYEIIAELGRGGSSRIYRAWDRIGEREVAVKVIPNDADDRQRFALRFEREVQAFAQLHHPNVVEVYGRGETEDLVYLVMRCVHRRHASSMAGQPAADLRGGRGDHPDGARAAPRPPARRHPPRREAR